MKREISRECDKNDYSPSSSFARTDVSLLTISFSTSRAYPRFFAPPFLDYKYSRLSIIWTSTTSIPLQIEPNARYPDKDSIVRCMPKSPGQIENDKALDGRGEGCALQFEFICFTKYPRINYKYGRQKQPNRLW